MFYVLHCWEKRNRKKGQRNNWEANFMVSYWERQTDSVTLQPFWYHSWKIKYAFNIYILSVFKRWCFTASCYSRPSFYSFILCALPHRVLLNHCAALCWVVYCLNMLRLLLSLKVHILDWISEWEVSIYITVACFPTHPLFSYVYSWCRVSGCLLILELLPCFLNEPGFGWADRWLKVSAML